MIKIFSAPLQGFTEAPWRNLHEQLFGGVDAYYTPFVRLEKGHFRNKDIREVSPANNTVSNLIPQVIASMPDELRTLIQFTANLGYKAIDINMGCPFPPITGRCKGAGILPFPDKVEALLQILREFPGIAFSIKMRLGLTEPDEWLHLLPLFSSVPLQRIVLHPRVGKQQYKGDVDIDAFRAFYESTEIPMVYNGDLCTLEDIQSIADAFPRLEGVMLGRGLLARPSLASEFRSGQSLSEQAFKEQVLKMHDALFTYYSNTLEGGDCQILTKMKTFWEYLSESADKKWRKSIQKSNSLSAYRAVVNNY